MDTVLTVRLNFVRENYDILSDLCAHAGAPVLKANAYGLGAPMLAKALFKLDTDRKYAPENLFVATLEEGVALRETLKNSLAQEPVIYVLHGVKPDEINDLKEHSLSPILKSKEDIELWKSEGNAVPCGIQFNLGFNRLGINNVLEVIGDFKPDMVLGHLSCSDEPENPINQTELENFKTVARYFPQARRSLSASGGVMLGKDYHFDLARLGISLYGPFLPPDNLSDKMLKNALSVATKVLQIRNVERGAYVGYNAQFYADRPMRLAVLGMGYADGLMRAFNKTGRVKFYLPNSDIGLPVVGKISMDSVMIDISALEHDALKVGDEVYFLDNKRNLAIVADDLEICPHEILCALGNAPRITKNYLD